MTRLILIRHGETDWNRERRIQGRTDIPLNERGRQQARETADRLAPRLDSPSSTVIVSSDLSRAAETADIIAEAWNARTPRRYASLRERVYGEAEGSTVEEFTQRWGDWYTAEVPGAETRAEVRDRALLALAEVENEALAAEPDLESIIVVAHGALIRAVIDHATDGAFPPAGERLANGSDHTVLTGPDGLTLLEYAGAPLPLFIDTSLSNASSH